MKTCSSFKEALSSITSQSTIFVYGAAALSEGGKPILAFTSRTAKGHPRIVSSLKQGAGVVTTRAHVHHVVTEFGSVNLYGKTLNERAHSLINISHPDDREILDQQWFEIKKKISN
jgi:acyl-CoA hydrolase